MSSAFSTLQGVKRGKREKAATGEAWWPKCFTNKFALQCYAEQAEDDNDDDEEDS